MPSTRTLQQEIDYCHDVMATWRKFAKAMMDAEKYEHTSREEPARHDATKAKRKLMDLGEWPGYSARG